MTLSFLYLLDFRPCYFRIFSCGHRNALLLLAHLASFRAANFLQFLGYLSLHRRLLCNYRHRIDVSSAGRDRIVVPQVGKKMTSDHLLWQVIGQFRQTSKLFKLVRLIRLVRIIRAANVVFRILAALRAVDIEVVLTRVRCLVTA
jgi:hypothetical protein